MKRASFLRALVALPAAVAGLAAVKQEPAAAAKIPGGVQRIAATDIYVDEYYGLETQRALLDVAENWTGFRPAWAHIGKLPQTGDARKFQIELGDWSGRIARKYVVVGGGPTDVPGRRSHLAYVLYKRTQECAIDLAHMNGHDWRAYSYAARHGLR